jgi:hypothetical protein
LSNDPVPLVFAAAAIFKNRSSAWMSNRPLPGMTQFGSRRIEQN